MTEYKSAQELILKAALCDGVSTTICPSTQGYRNAVEVVFAKGDARSSIVIDLFFDDERPVLYGLKRALFNLFEYPYRDIVAKEDKR